MTACSFEAGLLETSLLLFKTKLETCLHIFLTYAIICLEYLKLFLNMARRSFSMLIVLKAN